MGLFQDLKTPLGLEKAQQVVDKVVDSDHEIKFLLHAMDKRGCPVPNKFFLVKECTQSVSGGYYPPEGIIVCANHLAREEDIKMVMRHELIHAYDHCRAKDMDWTSCRHHACSEIRAAVLSGDCKFSNEMLRGKAFVDNFQGKFQECVERRATESVSMNPHCQGAAAKRAVRAVWDMCFNDTSPFPRIPSIKEEYQESRTCQMWGSFLRSTGFAAGGPAVPGPK